MNAVELLDSLAGVPGVRLVPSAPPITGALVVAGAEVAAIPPTADRAFRAAWRRRRGGAATPLLLVTDAADRRGALAVLGPQSADTDVRTIDAADLAAVLSRLAGLSRLEAVRQLAAELDRLDQRGIPGLRLSGLLTQHTVEHRVRRNPLRWGQLGACTKDLTRGSDWQTVLRGLGYEVQRRAVPKTGHLLRFEGHPVAVVHPLADPSRFARLDEEGKPPEGKLLNDCAEEGVRFGLLVSGSRLRLFDAAPTAGAAASRWIDLDAGGLRSDDLAYLGVLSPGWLAQGLLAALDEEARQYGTALRRRLDDTIRQRALPSLAAGLSRWAEEEGLDVADDEVREDLERAALTLLFRALFLLYCESAGYLPMDHVQYQAASVTGRVASARAEDGHHDPAAKMLWDQFVVVVKTMRTGKMPWGVPAYNGALFAPEGFDGAATLERLSLTDAEWGPVLVGLGWDDETGTGVDYSTLAIGHLGHLYEGLLSLRLSVADVELAYDTRADKYLPAGRGDVVAVQRGELLWQTHEGGRKGGGVYYTPQPLVAHLVAQAVAPAFEAHLARVADAIPGDPEGAARQLFDFAVLDPACGSAHFLVEVVDHLADRLVRFLARHPLPGVTEAVASLRAGAAAGMPIDDVALLRRLLLKRCVHGVDRSRMGAEIAKVSLWLTSFVPGLSLAYLDRNVCVGNSLVGVVDLGPLIGEGGALFCEAIDEALRRGTEAAAQVAAGADRTPDEYRASAAADEEAHAATAGLSALCDLWTARPFGVAEAAQYLLHADRVVSGGWPADLMEGDVAARLADLRARHAFFHWPVAFPRVFQRPNAGFDAVIGNPPWNEVTIERLAFYGLYWPRLRSLGESQRNREIAELIVQRPALEAQLQSLQSTAEVERGFFRQSPDYPSMPGDPDLYKFFCRRYEAVLRNEGRLGVVLPRSAFSTLGSGAFRAWLFGQTTTDRLDILENKGSWAFDAEPRYTVALVAAERRSPEEGHRVRVAGVARSAKDWEQQAASPGLAYAPEAFGPGWTVPLLRNQAEADVLAKVRHGTAFPFGGGTWRCFPVAELHETNDKALWDGKRSGRPLWKGESFDQYDPAGAEARWCPDTGALKAKRRKPNPGMGSVLGDVPKAERRTAVLGELDRPRVAFRDVSRATDSRTVRACLAPPEAVLTNKAPYLAFLDGGWPGRLACLAVLNSVPFDWQARRFVEINLNFFILEGLVVPRLEEATQLELARAAGRLSSVDDRYTEVAESLGVDVGPVPPAERLRLRAHIDATVARAWGLDRAEVEVLLADFTVGAMPIEHRRLMLDELG
ncbi:MAG: hypothetical protein WKF86_02990 [Acidimicrobiales bacterium]